MSEADYEYLEELCREVLPGPAPDPEKDALKAEVQRQRRKRKEDVQRLRDWHEGIEGLRLSVGSLRAERDALKARVKELWNMRKDEDE